MQPLKAVLFDLEGTLVDSFYDMQQSLTLLLADLGRPPLPEPQARAIYDDGLMSFVEKALKATGGMPSEDIFPYVKKFILFHRHTLPDPAQIVAGVVEILRALKDQGIKIGLCTNNSEVQAKDLLEKLGLARYFDFIAGGDTFQVHKPNPGHLLGALAALGESVEGSLFIGDGPRDATAAFRAGMPYILITHGQPLPFEASGTMRTVNDFSEIREAVRDLGFVF
ncbi:MAG: HAD-IA family hydrolase [Alphaproteobacteria bacterium]|nr:HAD-IA family hydrolase [Alphaproteobacteria bacterium]